MRLTLKHLIAFAVLTAATTYWGQHLSLLAPAGPPTFWPADGVCFAFLLVSRPRQWWRLVLVFLLAGQLANVAAGKDLSLLLWVTKAASLSVGAWLTQKVALKTPPHDLQPLGYRNGAALVVIGALLTPALTSVVTSLAVPLHPDEPSLLQAWRFHFAGTSLGILTVTPFAVFALTWLGRKHRRVASRALLADLSLLVLALVVTHFVFSQPPGHLAPPHSPFIVFALVIAVAFRGKPGLTATTNLGVAMVIIWHTLHFRGLAGVDPDRINAMGVIQLLLGVMILTSELLNLAIVARNHAASQLAAQGDELRRLNAELEQAKQAADAASDAKSRFLANMSHEIRSPLGAMIGFAELLLSENPSELERRGYAEIIRRNGLHLGELINQILDLSKVEAGRFEVELAPTNLHDLIADVAKLMDLKATEKRLRLAVEISERTPHIVLTDGLRVRQILINALGNAIKFTQEGSVTLRVDADAQQERWQVRFEIVDTGIGLMPEEQQRLFQAFSQADATIARKYGGTGLGLALSRCLARLLGGDFVLLRSEKGIGSSFALTIDGGPKTAIVACETSKPAEAPARAHPLMGRRILLAEDAPDSRLLVRRYLEIAGAEVYGVENGREALAAAYADAFDLVLMDVEMPELDGIAAVEALRARHYTTPVIALSGRAMQSEIDASLKAGFDGHLVKPIDRNILVQTVARFLRGAEDLPQRRNAHETSTPRSFKTLGGPP